MEGICAVVSPVCAGCGLERDKAEGKEVTRKYIWCGDTRMRLTNES